MSALPSTWVSLRFLAASIAVTVVSVPLASAATPAPALPSYNLSSTSHSSSIGTLSSPVTIIDAGHKQTVSSGMFLTPAQTAAVQQVLHTGTQSLVLGLLGNATGGSLVLSAQNLSSLVVPHGVTVVSDFSSGSKLTISGALTNSGDFYALSTNSAVSNARISANSISNLSGGLITTVLPTGGISGYSNAVSGLGLTLSSVNSIVNHGTISSAGSLTLNGSGNNFSVNNSGGTISAAGAINANGAGSAGSTISLLGGNWLSPVVNANAGAGNLLINVDQLTGTLNVAASNSHVFSGSNLLLGNTDVANDPTFVTTGNFATAGTLTESAALTIIAGGNIDLGTATGNDNFIYSTNFAGTGNQLTIIAGASFTPNNGPAQATSPIKVTGGSASGGNITCEGCTIDSSSPGSAAGGAILLAAYKGATANSGTISLNSSSSQLATIKSSSGSGKAGNITIIAPGGITVGTILAGGLVTGSKITLATAAPTGTLTAAANGSITGALAPGTVSAGSSSIAFTNVNDAGATSSFSAPGATVSVTSSNAITVDSGSTTAFNFSVAGNVGTGQAGGSINFSALGSGNSISLGGNTSSAAAVALSAGGGSGAIGTSSVKPQAGGAGGSITLSAVAGGAIINGATAEADTISASGARPSRAALLARSVGLVAN